MKKYLLGLLMFISVSTLYSQSYELGLKGGVNYSMGGEIVGTDSGANYWGGVAEGEGALGFHGGLFGQLNFGKFFVRPEIVYTKQVQDFDIPMSDVATKFTVTTLTIPLMVGYNIYGPLDLYAGPVYTNVLDATIENIGDPDRLIVVQSSPINFQLGTKVEFGKFGLDVRYEYNLSEDEPETIRFNNNLYGGPNGGANKATFTKKDLDQVIVSLTFKIFDSEKKGRRRGKACY